MKRGVYRTAAAVGLATLAGLLAFQNCTGFEAASQVGTATSASRATGTTTTLPTTTTTTTTTTTVSSKTFSATEWQPFDIKLPAGWSASDAPTGALVDSSGGTFRWVPTVGQAGTYNVHLVDASGAAKGTMTLVVSAIAAAKIAKGPSDGGADGDVGFVFVHGMALSNYCQYSADLDEYWGATPNTIARGSSPKKVACYDGRAAVESQAASVAQQIIAADCGRFNRCIIITHSMGGLMLEFMLSHARAATAADPEPALFASSALYAAAKKKMLAVVSIASASGGANAATILNAAAPSSTLSLVQNFVRTDYDFTSNAFKSLVVARSTGVLSPLGVDPGVPFLMVPGFTAKTSAEAGISVLAALSPLVTLPYALYQAYPEYAALDPVLNSSSRSDGLIEMRSSCGIASGNATDGPGYSAALATQLKYCYSSAKKPNHSVWFVTNLNHDLNKLPWDECASSASLCQIYEPDAGQASYTVNASMNGLSAVDAIRSKIDANRGAYLPVTGTFAQ